MKLFRALPKTDEARVLGKQVLRSGTSVAANYRAVYTARSRAEFLAKMEVVVEEADETVFWSDLMVGTGVIKPSQMEGLLAEANELLAIFAASQRTVKRPMVQYANDPIQSVNEPMGLISQSYVHTGRR